MADNKKKQDEHKAPVDPKRNVQTIEPEHLEDVVGGFDDGGFGPNLRMATEN